MRKIISLGLAVFAMVFTTCMSGYAQVTDIAIPGCDPCQKCELWNIPANGCSELLQGQTATQTVFDWDATYGYCQQQGTANFTYAGTQNHAVRNCRLVVNICRCEDTCLYDEGWVVGVQMEILTPGVYFAVDPDVPRFDGSATAKPAGFDNINVAGTNCYSENTYQLRFRRSANANVTEACGTSDMLAAGRTTYDTMKIQYYQNTTTANQGTELTWAQNGPGATGERLAKVIKTPTPYDGWELTDDDRRNQRCHFWFDVPAMIASGTVTSGQHVELKTSILFSPPLVEVEPSDAARINYLRPENATTTLPPAVDHDTGRWVNGEADWLLGAPPFIGQGEYWENDCGNNTACATAGFNGNPADGLSHADGDATDIATYIGSGQCLWEWDNQYGTGFCPDCAQSCSCTIDLGILCCEAAEGAFCKTFPYVLQQADDEDGNGSPDWSTGIALSRLCSPAEGITPTVTLTLTDCDGTEFTHTISDFGNCLSNPGMTVDQMVSEYGWTPVAGQAWLQVDSNFPIGGYQFNMYYGFGNMFGAGVLPIDCEGCQ